MKFTLSTLLFCMTLIAPAIAQQAADDHAAHHPAATTTATTAAADLADAEVRKVDKDAAKVTLKHGEIKSLDMPPMTMVFSVRDKAMLDSVKAGDKVRFRVVNDAGKYTVTELQVVR
ncbi:MAG: copper-binding protein [Rubrivivax sp.]|nr:copper-binding protein [Rubrivivax sp.]